MAFKPTQTFSSEYFTNVNSATQPGVEVQELREKMRTLEQKLHMQEAARMALEDRMDNMARQHQAQMAQLLQLVESKLSASSAASVCSEEGIGSSEKLAVSCETIKVSIKIVPGEGLGVSFGGGFGTDFGCLFIRGVSKTCQYSEPSSKLCVGDKVLKINGADAFQASPATINQYLATARSPVTVEVVRDQKFAASVSGISSSTRASSQESLSSEDKKVHFANHIKRKMYAKQDNPFAVNQDESILSPIKDSPRKLSTTQPSCSQGLFQDELDTTLDSELDDTIQDLKSSSFSEECSDIVKRLRRDYPHFDILQLTLSKLSHETGFGMALEHTSEKYRFPNRSDGIVVASVRRESAAGRSGIQPRDQIMDINGEDIRYLPCKEVVEYLGDCGEEISVIVARESSGTKAQKDFTCL